MSKDEDFNKKLMKFLSDLMSPEGMRKLQEFIAQNPDLLKNNPFFQMSNINPADFQKILENLTKNPNVKINFGTFPPGAFPFPNNFQNVNNEIDQIEEVKENIPEPECFWIEDEYHIILDHNVDELKFKTGVHKKNKNVVLFIKDKSGNTKKVVKLPLNIQYKKLKCSFNNGIYEIVYKKAES